MEFVVISLILCSLFLTAVFVMSRALFKTLEEVTQQITKVTSQQMSALKHQSNLLASKDPLAFQQLTAVSETQPLASNLDIGPYLTGDELELLQQRERELDAAWQSFSSDSEE